MSRQAEDVYYGPARVARNKGKGTFLAPITSNTNTQVAGQDVSTSQMENEGFEDNDFDDEESSEELHGITSINTMKAVAFDKSTVTQVSK